MKQKITPEEELRKKLSHTSVPDPAEGWEAMQPLLDRRNVAQKPKYLFPRYKRIAAAAVLLLLTGLSTWFFVLKKDIHIPGNQNSSETAMDPSIHLQNNQPTRIPQKQKVLKKPSVAVSNKMAEGDHQIIPAEKTLLTVNNKTHKKPFKLTRIPSHNQIAVKTPSDFTSLDVAVGNIPTLKPPNTGHKQAPKQSGNIALNRPTQEAPPAVSHKLHIGIHLNANEASSFGHPQENFNPILKGTPVDVYPSVSINKKISKKWGLRAALALASPVDVSPDHFNRSISDPQRAGISPMAADSRDEFQISRLYYADLPVTFQYHLSSRLTVGSGLQLSILEKVIGKKQRVDYTAYNTVLYRAPAEPSPQNLMNNGKAKAGIRPLDLRWLSSLRYSLSDHWVASVQFQYGLTDISNNATFLHHHKDRNVVVSAGIGFLIK